VSSQLILQPDAELSNDAPIMNGANSDVNFDDSGTLTVGTIAFGKTRQYARILLRFDLSDLPANAMILNATLRLVQGGGGTLATGGTFVARRLTRTDWTETGVTWNSYDAVHAWTAPGGDFSTTDQQSVTLSGLNQDLEFNALTNLAIDSLELRSALLSLLVVGPEVTNSTFVNFRPSEYEIPEERPRLTVTYAAPRLTVVDHADGSGATATLSGAADGSNNQLFMQSFQGELADGEWASAGSLMGNGDVTLDLPPGHYFAQAVSTLGTLLRATPVVYFVVSDAQESIHTRCAAAVQARIRLLALSGVSSEQVVIEKVPAIRNRQGADAFPAIIITPQRTAMPTVAGTNGRDDVQYDVLVAMIDRDNQEPTLTANLDRHLLWRQQVARAFRNQRLLGVPEVINSEVEPAEGLLDDAWKRELMASALLLRFTSREPRGF